MKKHIACAILLLMAFENSFAISIQQAESQTRKPDSKAEQKKDDKTESEDTLRLAVTLVQADVVVTDSKGRPVTDLKREDFEVLEDGRPHEITNFSYISLERPAVASKPEAVKEGEDAPPVPVSQMRAEQVRRTIALVVDDLESSFESVVYMKDSLRKFVDEQMQEGDIVTIIRTGAGVGALQQFTTDKRQLRAAINRIRWKPSSRAGITGTAPVDTSPKADTNILTEDASRGREDTEKYDREIQMLGKIGALNLVVKGMRDWPGRKMVMFFSDGFVIHNSIEISQRLLDVLRRVTDLANRNSVVIYTMDARGLETDFSAADAQVQGATDGRSIGNLLGVRSQARFLPQEGLAYLAKQTGGFLIKNTNNLNKGIERILDDQRGYYLIGYIPEKTSKSEESKGHKVEIRVKRPGLEVRSRSSFYRAASEVPSSSKRNPSDRMLDALSSPFSSGDFDLKLTSLFAHDAATGSFIQSLLHIDLRGITFKKQSDGWMNSKVEIHAVAFGDNGQVVDRVSRPYNIQMREDTFERYSREGLVYSINVPVKYAGPYQLRALVLDVASGRTGSANQFVEVPDLKRYQLTLSGIAVSGSALASGNSTAEQVANRASDGARDDDAQSGPAVRKLKPGMFLDYGLAIYNARVDAATSRPKLEMQVVLYRDGKRIYAGSAIPVEPGAQENTRSIMAGGRIRLPDNFEPGEYILQVIVTDKIEKQRSATEWIDFEVIK
jgi:VWFA-related protein